MPLACSIQTRLAHFDLAVGQLDRGVDQLGGHQRQRPQGLDLRR
jgi:hypothetical protein